MTKVTIIGQEPKTEKKLKPIEFILSNSGDNWGECAMTPADWENIELMALEYSRGMDLMFAYNTNRSDSALYLGHFNDGVVE